MPYVTAWRRTTLLLSKNKGGHTEPALIGAAVYVLLFFFVIFLFLRFASIAALCGS